MKSNFKNVKIIRHMILLALIVSFYNSTQAQKKILYKQIDTIKLHVDIYYPPSYDSTKNYPAIVFFFGGGWINGDRKQFVHHAEYFSKRGAVCFLPDYRTKENNSNPCHSLKDAKSVIRFIRKRAKEFAIDPGKIIASGGSAGGQLAAAAALIDKFNEEKENITISCIPNALVLFNPVVDNGPGGYGYDRIGDQYKDFSPLHNIRRGAPPTIIFSGTKDKLVSVASLNYYKSVMEKVGSRCDLKLYEGETHGFFNYRHFENYRETIIATDAFLQSLGYLTPEPIVIVQ
jgi:acetyl esterase